MEPQSGLIVTISERRCRRLVTSLPRDFTVFADSQSAITHLNGRIEVCFGPFHDAVDSNGRVGSTPARFFIPSAAPQPTRRTRPLDGVRLMAGLSPRGASNPGSTPRSQTTHWHADASAVASKPPHQHWQHKCWITHVAPLPSTSKFPPRAAPHFGVLSRVAST